MREEFKNLAQYIQDKNVLCVPIISSINRKTGEYKLDADGNVNRIITTFWHADTYKKLTIVLPSKHTLGSDSLIYQWINMKSSPEHEIEVIWSENFGIHAGEQRSNYFVINKLFHELANYFNGNFINVYMIESQGLLDKAFPSIVTKDVIFWNYTCTTNKKTRSFLNGYKEVNERFFKACDKTIVASPEQVEYFNEVVPVEKNKMMYIPTFMDRDIPLFKYAKDTVLDQKLKRYSKVFKIFYLPYRMTDEGYLMNDVIQYINADPNDFKMVLYGDPNNSGYMDTIKDKFDGNVMLKKVSTSRNVYYTILDCDANITIPYFEDIAYINHASIQEFIDDRCKCQIVLANHDTIDPYGLSKHDNVRYLAPLHGPEREK